MYFLKTSKKILIASSLLLLGELAQSFECSTLKQKVPGSTSTRFVQVFFKSCELHLLHDLGKWPILMCKWPSREQDLGFSVVAVVVQILVVLLWDESW